MPKAFVDTTILADATLKTGARREAALRALAAYTETQLPVFAIKEFKQGVLKTYVWFHNLLSDGGSFAKAVAALHRMGFTPRRQRSQSALEALSLAAQEYAQRTLGDLGSEYGLLCNADKCLADEYRDFLRYLILDAWDQRRAITTHVVNELACYSEAEPFLNNGQIEVDPTRCAPAPECAMAQQLRTQADDVKKLIAILDGKLGQAKSQRTALLRLLLEPPERIRHGDCRALGDSIFALLCPDDCVILTTNGKDHIPLANAIGKKVETP